MLLPFKSIEVPKGRKSQEEGEQKRQPIDNQENDNSKEERVTI